MPESRSMLIAFTEEQIYLLLALLTNQEPTEEQNHQRARAIAQCSIALYALDMPYQGLGDIDVKE